MTLGGPSPHEDLPRAYGGCTCVCHRQPGVKHIHPCCASFVGLTLEFDEHPHKPRYRYITTAREPIPSTTLAAILRLSYANESHANSTVYRYRSLTGLECVAVRTADCVVFLQCLDQP